VSYKVVLPRSFKKCVKRLKKRYPQVNNDVTLVIRELVEAPKLGVVIPGGSGARKIRVLNSDVKKGKRSGYRLIYYVQETPIPTLYPLLLYIKSDKADASRSELATLLDELAAEFDL
jgi:mRNA-degrading endonuclease RelE of RelBE toxin-antitoxin system